MLARVTLIGCVATLVVAGLAPSWAGGADETPAVSHTTDPEVFRQVEPILQARCVRCHNSRNASANLRLDAPGAVKDARFATVDPAQNELFQRLVATDPKVRMPLGEPPLTADELATFRTWIAEQQPWPPPPKNGQAPAAPPTPDLQVLQALTDAMRWMWPSGVVGVLILLSLLVFERLKLRSRAGAWPRWGAWRERFGQGAYLAVLAAVVAVGVIHVYHAQVLWLQRKLQSAQLAIVTRQAEQSVIEPPPTLVRPNVPKRLQSTYYRGNCERNPALFNGGNYCTALMHLSVRGKSDQPLAPGAEVGEEELTVLFEIERAPHATDALFTEAIMSAIELTREQPTSGKEPVTPPIKMTVVEPGQRWSARIPIGKVPAEGSLGVIYVAKDKTAHYGITFDLKVVDGKLTAESDLWMNALYQPQTVASPSLMPFREWLDHEPLPMITGENTRDPKLLGVEEHVPAKPAPTPVPPRETPR